MSTTTPEGTAAEAAVEPVEVHGCPATVVRGATVVHVDAAGYERLVKALHAEGYTYCADLCAVDQLTNAGRRLPEGVEAQRFEVVVTVRDLRQRRALRLRCQVPADQPVLPTLFGLYPGTEAMEREVFDLMGIAFSGHPDLTRILLPDDWEGHPLRKDYPIGGEPVRFSGEE